MQRLQNHCYVLTDTFEDSKLAFRETFHLSYYWVSQTPVFVAETHLDLSKPRIVDKYKFYRDVGKWKLVNNSITLGGVGMAVEIDKSAVYKVKYNVGHGLQQQTQWVFFYLLFYFLL